MGDGRIRKLSPLVIHHFAITQVDSGKEIELDPSHIIDLNIYESIVSPGITGSIKFQDIDAVKELEEIGPGDQFEFSISTEGRDQLYLGFEIYASRGDQLAIKNYSSHAQMSSFQFASPWLIEAATKPLSRSWQEKTIHDMVKDLVEACGGTWSGRSEQTAPTIEHFVTPLWTPLHTIKYLMSLAQSGSGSGGYVIFTDLELDEVIFSSIDKLLQVDNPDEEGFHPRTHQIRNPKRVHQQFLESNFDSLLHVNAGLPKTTYYSFNYDRTKHVKTDKKMTDFGGKRLGATTPIATKYDDDAYTSIKFSSVWPNTRERIKEEATLDKLTDARLGAHYAYLWSDLFKVTLVSNPDSSRRAGNLAKISWPSIADNKTAPNVQFAGEWLIRDIHHAISSSNWDQIITLCGDGYKEIKRSDLMKW